VANDDDAIRELVMLPGDSPLLGAERGIQCPRCGMRSFNPNDIREGYCGKCHDWTTPR
jgi:hypothetical protein